jgi:predicted regulator of Ras-like GTPase activity (Roadblock/LC7/MglB family)
MNAIPVLTIDDVATLDGVLADFLKKAEAELTVVIDRGGNVISQYGDMTVMDVTIIAALAAGSFAATRELARRIGEVEFNALYHQGNGSHIFMNSVDEETIMITVFGPRTTVGLVRFYSTGTAQQVALLLKSLQKGNHGFSFDASDITAATICICHTTLQLPAPRATLTARSARCNRIVPRGAGGSATNKKRAGDCLPPSVELETNRLTRTREHRTARRAARESPE